MPCIRNCIISYNMSVQRPQILFCMHMPPPVHGAAVVGQQIYDSQLIRDKFDCSFVNYSTSGTLGEIGRFSVKKIVTVIQFIKSVQRKLNEQHPQLVYITPSLSGWAFYRDWFMMRMLKHNKCTIIAHFHNKPPLAFTQKWYNKWLYRSFFNGIHTIFLANSLAATFRDYLTAGHIHICPNGMPDNQQCQSEKSYERLYSFLFLSNMMEEKGVIVLMEACALLKKRGCHFECHFIGQWSDITEQRFKSLSDDLDISTIVHAHGGVYGHEKAKFFSRADAFIFPTYYTGETFGLVLLEAMQYSLPIISTPEGGIPDVIDDKVGFLVEQRNSAALADKMQYFIEHPNVGREMGTQGRLKYEREYTLPKFESRITDILTNVIKTSGLQ